MNNGIDGAKPSTPLMDFFTGLVLPAADRYIEIESMKKDGNVVVGVSEAIKPADKTKTLVIPDQELSEGNQNVSVAMQVEKNKQTNRTILIASGVVGGVILLGVVIYAVTRKKG